VDTSVLSLTQLPRVSQCYPCGYPAVPDDDDHHHLHHDYLDLRNLDALHSDQFPLTFVTQVDFALDNLNLSLVRPRLSTDEFDLF